MGTRDESAAGKKRVGRQKGYTATASQKSAGAANLAKGRESRQRKREEAEAREAAGEVLMSGGERWAMLLDGTLSVEDLDDDEIAKCNVKNKDGVVGAPRKVPSHLVAKMQAEAIKRATAQFRSAAPQAVKRLIEIANDPDTKDADAIRALTVVLERSMGKTPDIVRIEGQSPFDAMLAAAIGLDRDMVDEP